MYNSVMEEFRSKRAFYVDHSVQHDGTLDIGPGAVVLQGRQGTPTVIGHNVSIGANATVLGGVRLGDCCVVEPGAVVREDVPAFCIVGGNPAVVIGYQSTALCREAVRSPFSTLSDGATLLSNGARSIKLRRVKDVRGSLCVAEFPDQGLPFLPNRVFFVFDVPSEEVRGQHAHKHCHQFLIAVGGAVSTIVDDGRSRREVLLDHPSMGLYMPPMTWGIQQRYSSDARLLVMASHSYDPDDYIRDYESFLEMVDKSA
jgi:UDP-2-acetamido-3-amino-2,3-dideoxy-glucuronate N-acetyltransferase